MSEVAASWPGPMCASSGRNQLFRTWRKRSSCALVRLRLTCGSSYIHSLSGWWASFLTTQNIGPQISQCTKNMCDSLLSNDTTKHRTTAIRSIYSYILLLWGVLWLDNLKEKLSLSFILTEVKGQTSVIVQSDPSNSIKGSLLLGRRCGGIAVVMGLQIPISVATYQ